MPNLHEVAAHLFTVNMRVHYHHPLQPRRTFIHVDDRSNHNLHISMHIEITWDADFDVTSVSVKVGGMLTSPSGEPVFMLAFPIELDRLMMLRAADMQYLKNLGDHLRDERASIGQRIQAAIKHGVV